MIRWETVKADFKWDGTLRDIYISPATMDDWRAIYPLLTKCPGVQFLVDGSRQMPPADVEAIFAQKQTASPSLQVMAGRCAIVFHFFSSEEIECDIDPRQITSQADLDALLEFVRQLGRATQKNVVITPENVGHEQIISYSVAANEFQYHEPVL